MLVKIIVATHKAYRMPTDPMYLPVFVGAKGKKSIGFQRDDEGENISELNPFFCELTGLYWAWKNLECDYLGLVHYRRHFSTKKKTASWESVLKQDDRKEELGKIKVFVPGKRRYLIENLYDHYKHTHYAEQLDETRHIIEENYPEYVEAYDKTIKQTWGYMFNMMIMEKGLADEYCEWLFDILFMLRGRCSAEGLSPYQARYFGRVSEILFNVWLNQKLTVGTLRPKEVKEIPFISMEKVNWGKKGMAFLRAKFLGKRYEGSF